MPVHLHFRKIRAPAFCNQSPKVPAQFYPQRGRVSPFGRLPKQWPTRLHILRTHIQALPVQLLMQQCLLSGEFYTSKDLSSIQNPLPPFQLVR
mmetsp:Transcript_116212/g.224206  ORF Transcript_116212/g.224206 Transcript_116212/m.224206 type:complete len:93 (+) Transcript_116212:297-575(+)